jgi:hypothetical protein
MTDTHVDLFRESNRRQLIMPERSVAGQTAQARKEG